MQPSKANHNSPNVLEVVAFLAMVRRTFNQNSQFANMVPINEVLMDFSNSSKFNGQEVHQNDCIVSLFDSKHLTVHSCSS